MLYSANRFVIYYSKPGSLKPLHALTPLSLASLASLKVVPNEAACHAPSPYDVSRSCCRCGSEHTDIYSSPAYYKEHHIGLHSRPLTSCTSAGNGDERPTTQIMLNEWHAAAVHLSSHINPGQLDLSLICDIDYRQGGRP